MTEEEAKTKWCPMVRNLSIVGEFAVNRGSDQGENQNCVGSDCMMWRTTENNRSDGMLFGHCGLAGKL